MAEHLLKSIDCLRCHTRMEAGFIPDLGEGIRQQNWAPGVPEPSFWTGLKMKKEDIYFVVTYRCPNCGYLESYAASRAIEKE
jgi:hypothetical protein